MASLQYISVFLLLVVLGLVCHACFTIQCPLGLSLLCTTPHGDARAIRTTKLNQLLILEKFSHHHPDNMAYVHMFYGDHQASDKPWTFLRQFEEDLTELPHLSKTKKCYHFYNYCCSGSDAKYWYEELKCNLLKVLTSWFTPANHFCVKWLHTSPNILLEITKIEPVTITEPDAATTVSHETTTTTHHHCHSHTH